ncbi:hypothetical protein [Ensifer canadensis]
MRIRLVVDRIILEGRDIAAGDARALEQSLSQSIEAAFAARLKDLDAGRLRQRTVRLVVGALPPASPAGGTGDLAGRVSGGLVDALAAAGVLPAAGRLASAPARSSPSTGRARTAAGSDRSAP